MQEDEPNATSPSPDATSRPVSPRPMTRLAARLANAARESGKPLATFVSERSITRSNWYKIMDGHIPYASTVVQLADALGIPRAELLSEAGYPLEPSTREPERRPQPDRTPLGEVLHAAQVATGESVSRYCHERGIARKTWTRIVDDGQHPRESTVSRLATQTGLDRDLLLRKAGYSVSQPLEPS